MKVKFTLSIGISNCTQSEIFEFPDETTEDELEEEWLLWTSNYIDGSQEIIDDGK